jgi:replicative DNA helicase
MSEFLNNYSGDDRIVTSEEIKARISKEGIRKPISCGIQALDEIIGGFYEEQVVVITARPKSGKSSMALHIADRLNEYSPLFLALEQSPQELIEQLIEQDRKIPFFYAPESIEGVDKTTDWIHLKTIESQFLSQKQGRTPTKVVLVDHFGYILRKQSSDQVTWEIIKIMQELKNIAKHTKTTIVVIVHTTKGDPTVPPSTEDLFGSSGYHQEADTVLSLWRETYKEEKKIMQTNNVLLQVLANRKKGTSGAVKMVFEDGEFFVRPWEGKDEFKSRMKAKADKAFDNF